MRPHALKYPSGGTYNVVGLPGGQRSRLYQREIGAGRVTHQNAWPAGFPARGEHQCELQQDFDNLLDYLD